MPLSSVVGLPSNSVRMCDSLHVVSWRLGGAKDALQQCAVPAALLSAGTAPGPGPAFQWGCAAHKHTGDQAIRASSGDADAVCELLTGDRVDGRVVVMDGQDTERLGNGVTWRERQGGSRVRAVFKRKLVEDRLGRMGRAGETDQAAIQVQHVIAALRVGHDRRGGCGRIRVCGGHGTIPPVSAIDACFG